MPAVLDSPPGSSFLRLVKPAAFPFVHLDLTFCHGSLTLPTTRLRLVFAFALTRAAASVSPPRAFPLLAYDNPCHLLRLVDISFWL